MTMDTTLDPRQLEVLAYYIAGQLTSGGLPPAGGSCEQTDPDAFYPEKGDSLVLGKRVCRGCEIREACLEYALARDERFGVWGGMSTQQRDQYRRERDRRIAAEAAA